MNQLVGVIELAFDPFTPLGPLTLRWQTIGVTAALLLALTIAARHAARPPLRIPDLLLVLVAIVPGAIVGGRLVHAIAYLEFYLAQPVALFDPRLGTLSLLGAVLGGCISGAYVARLLGDHVLRWADAAALPLLIAIGLGKLAMVLGGSGQGLPFDGPWSLAFTGQGPWVSASPAMPAHPAQVYEGMWMLAGIPSLARVARRGPVGRGWMFAFAMCWFLVGRLLVGFTWRDTAVIGPLNVEQAIAGALLLGASIAALRGRDTAEVLAADDRQGPINGPTSGEGVS